MKETDKVLKVLFNIKGDKFYFESYGKGLIQRLLDAERGRFLQEKLAGYDVGSLEYKIIESMLKED